ncbi:MAG TPA: beta-propeller fold lactonase family protein [Steroidobacteraceae bacterium]|jgi:6-phosphogluconolactonase (cycloisomerase 2 family)|nr:beta-propeller fold lactonase family protein [Steroidobacteraceae bacterium]
MNHPGKALLLSAIAGVLAQGAHADNDVDRFGSAQHAVFVMTNDADQNAVMAYERTPYGTLLSPHRFETGGRGSGGTVDPLGSQGSLTLSDDGALLFAANAGSGTLSVFRVFGARLVLVDRANSGGSEPNAVAQHGRIVYVLNTAGSSSVVGFRLFEGKLVRIPDSQRFLSGNFVNPGSVAFSPDGRFLVVTERTSNSIDVFRVQSDGRLAPITVNPSAGPGAFAAVVAPNGTVLASETGTGSATSAASSYTIAPDGKLLPVSVSVPTLGAANCWNAVTPDGRFVYMSNAGTSSLAGFEIGARGALRPVGATIVGTNPAGSANLDITISADGKFLYSLNAGTGAIGMFGIESDGSLVNLGTTGGLPAAAGLNGIAAN